MFGGIGTTFLTINTTPKLPQLMASIRGVPRHGEIVLEDLPLFPAIYGFAASVFIVVVGIGLRHLLMRKGDYYD